MTNFITYDELISQTKKEEKQLGPDELWDFYIEKAKEAKPDQKDYRMYIAELAIRANLVRIGHKSKEYQVFGNRGTQANFAEELGLGYTTLSKWMKAKRYVYDHLRKIEQTDFTLNDAAIAVEEVRRKHGIRTNGKVTDRMIEQMVATYRHRRTLPWKEKGLVDAAYNLHKARNGFINQHKTMPLEQLVRCQAYAKEILRLCLNRLEIERIGNVLKSPHGRKQTPTHRYRSPSRHG